MILILFVALSRNFQQALRKHLIQFDLLDLYLLFSPLRFLQFLSHHFAILLIQPGFRKQITLHQQQLHLQGAHFWPQFIIFSLKLLQLRFHTGYLLACIQPLPFLKSNLFAHTLILRWHVLVHASELLLFFHGDGVGIFIRLVLSDYSLEGLSFKLGKRGGVLQLVENFQVALFLLVC